MELARKSAARAALLATVAACGTQFAEGVSSPEANVRGAEWSACAPLPPRELARRGWADLEVRACPGPRAETILLLSNERSAYPVLAWGGRVWSTAVVTEAHMPRGEVPEVVGHGYAWRLSPDGQTLALAYVVVATPPPGEGRSRPRAFVVLATPAGACLLGDPAGAVGVSAVEAARGAELPPTCPLGAESLRPIPG